ncbi:GHMP kinase [Thermogymnomonas acidicola]|uniref:GHMP kinase n=1 Tax=Thermogymnomonas acidicola TaxID=399579 RepID=A0AA37F9T8_9ARCH|nr:kinase [Thermogymnomonas acidicola]GGM71748.1 GHMP kinase [Thermogymnomonas acidicola]
MSSTITSYSPFRITFGGGGTDIEPFISTHGGFVVNATIDRGVRVSYKDDGHSLEISSRDLLRSYIVGANEHTEVLDRMVELLEVNGVKRGRILLNGDVPPGSGLGSSSALITATLRLIGELRGAVDPPGKMAEEAYDIEMNRFGVTLGRQDPYAIAIGGFKGMAFRGKEFTVHPIQVGSRIFSEIDGGTILVYTGKTRESTEALKDQVQASRSGDMETIGNLERMKDVAEKMLHSALSGDLDGFYSLVNAAWEIKKRLGSRVTSERVERIIGTALSSGARAARLMGGGRDGFVLVLCRPGDVDRIQSRLMSESEFVFRVSLDPQGTRILR